MTNEDLESVVRDKLKQCQALNIEQSLAAAYTAQQINAGDEAVRLGYKLAGDFIIFFSDPLGAEWRERYTA